MVLEENACRGFRRGTSKAVKMKIYEKMNVANLIGKNYDGLIAFY